MLLTDEFKLNEHLSARNRIGLSPMDTAMSIDGFVNDFHLQHYGSRSYGGFGFIIVESTAISSEGRIVPKDLGIWKNAHINGLKHLSKIIHQGKALAGIQLNHAGAKSQLTNERTVGATTKLYHYPNQDLALVTLKELKKIEEQFVQAARRAKKAGFDFVEIHGAHGYLLSELIHPQLNEVIVSDNICKRAQIVINIVKQIAEEVKIPVGIRLSVNDDHYNLKTVEQFKPLIEKLEPYLSYINVSSGDTTHKITNLSSIIEDLGMPIYRIPLAKKIKEMTKKPVIMGGNVSKREHIEKALKFNIDGILIGREALFNPHLVLNTILKPEEIDPHKYHWNDNTWFHPQKYSYLKEKLKTKEKK